MNVGSYTIASDGSSASFTETQTDQETLSTYWLYPKSGIAVKYQYCVNVPDLTYPCSQEVSATFDVSGPSAAVTATPSYWSVTPSLSCPTDSLQFLFFGAADPTSGCPPLPLVKGIQFQAALSGVPDSGGTTEWVQLISGNTLSGVDFTGTKAVPESLGVGLDTSYPYRPDDPYAPATTQASDSPDSSLQADLARETKNFRANMYYLWTPQVSGSIPVPLAYVHWEAYGTAVQHSKNSPPWSLSLSGPTTAQPYVCSETETRCKLPTWSNLVSGSQSNAAQLDDDENKTEE